MKCFLVGLALFVSFGTIHAQAQVASAVGSSSSAVEMVGRDIADWHDAEYPLCKMQKVVEASIKKQEKDMSTELWTIEGCNGKTFQYSVMIMFAQGGGFSTMVGNSDGSAFHTATAP